MGGCKRLNPFIKSLVLRKILGNFPTAKIILIILWNTVNKILEKTSDTTKIKSFQQRNNNTMKSKQQLKCFYLSSNLIVGYAD